MLSRQSSVRTPVQVVELYPVAPDPNPRGEKMAEAGDAMELVVKVAGFGLAGGVLVFLLKALLGA